MTEADIAQIEVALGYSTPHHYREFITRHAGELRRIKDTLPLRAVIHTEPDDVIGDNLFARRSPECFIIGEDNQPWPEGHFIIGTNGGGDYWFVHRDGSDPGLGFYSCEAHEVSRHHPSLEEYIGQLRQDMMTPHEWQ